MKKILILLACCALITNILPWSKSGIYCNRDAARACSNEGGAWRSKSTDGVCRCEITKESCENKNGTWYPTAQTCSLNECADRGQECWYGVCVDIKAGLKPENLEKGADLASKTDAEKDAINRKYCCELKFGQDKWDGKNSKCIGVDQ